MSELTQCNYCTLQRIQKCAERENQQVTILGQNCYVHPKDVNISELNEELKERYFVAWFMELTKGCAC
jgi:hypothetical protein